MGSGIAEIFAEAGYDVVWYNRSDMGLQRGGELMRANQATLIRHGVLTRTETAVSQPARFAGMQIIAERDALLLKLLQIKRPYVHTDCNC